MDFKFSTSAAADALVRRACHRLVIGCCGLTRATPAEDRRGTDYWVITDRGRVGLDLKLRRRDYGAKRGGPIPDGHFKFPHLWPLKLPQAGRSDYGFPEPV